MLSQMEASAWLAAMPIGCGCVRCLRCRFLRDFWGVGQSIRCAAGCCPPKLGNARCRVPCQLRPIQALRGWRQRVRHCLKGSCIQNPPCLQRSTLLCRLPELYIMMESLKGLGNSRLSNVEHKSETGPSFTHCLRPSILPEHDPQQGRQEARTPGAVATVARCRPMLLGHDLFVKGRFSSACHCGGANRSSNATRTCNPQPQLPCGLSCFASPCCYRCLNRHPAGAPVPPADRWRSVEKEEWPLP